MQSIGLYLAASAVTFHILNSLDFGTHSGSTVVGFSGLLSEGAAEATRRMLMTWLQLRRLKGL